MDLDVGPSNPKKRRVEGGKIKNKACLIVYCLDRETRPDTKMEYNIFIVDDLKSDGIVGGDDGGLTPISPTLQIDCGVIGGLITDAFCVLGETLYMFEGGGGNPLRKSVFAFDLTLTQTLTRHTRKLEKGGPLLRKIGDMTFPKVGPVAVPTPYGEKIVVFSAEEYRAVDAYGVFELFDPKNGSWKQLPSIMGRFHLFQVYGFIPNSNRLLVQIYCGGVYSLDLDSPDSKWEKLDAFYSGVEGISPSIPYPSFFETVDGGRFCFVNSCGFYDLEEFVDAYSRRDMNLLGITPSLQTLTRGMGIRRNASTDICVALLNYAEETGQCLFLYMLMERPQDDVAESCALAITVCSVDLRSYKKMVEGIPISMREDAIELKCSKIVRMHRFSVRFDGLRDVFLPHLFFAF